MSWSMPARRALNLTYVALVAPMDAEERAQVDKLLNPPPAPPTRAVSPAEDRAAAFEREWAAFAYQHGGEIG